VAAQLISFLSPEVITMTTKIRYFMLALGLLSLTACNKKEEVAVVQAPAPLVAPTNSDSMAWRMYMTEVVKRNLAGVTESPFMYFLPASEGDAAAGEFDRQLENVQNVVARTVLPGNMLAFGSPNPEKMTELIEAAFDGAPADSMKDVRVLFIGTAEQGERVRVAVEPTGAIFVLHELK
jgi:hypothetical protein